MINVEEKFNELCKNSHLIGASSIIVKNNKIDKIMNYGYSDLENKKLMTEDTIIRIASVSKIEVALCMMMLEEEGKVDLDEDISKYFGFTIRNPKYKDSIITLRMLMTQSSSISDGKEIYKEDGDIFTGYNYLLENGIKENVEELLKEGGKYYYDSFNDSKPGTKFEYSNFGCGILACIIERVSGKYFFDFFKERVSEKLGIKASFMASDFKAEDLSSSYDKDGKILRSNESFVLKSVSKRALGQNYIGPAGGLFISMKDLTKLMLAYMNDGAPLVKKETMDKMLQMNFIFDRDGDYTAKGLQIQILDEFDGRRLYGHFGTAYGIKTFLFFNPYQKIGMVFATSGGGFKMLENGISDVQNGLLQAFLDNYYDINFPLNVYFTPKDEYINANGRMIKVKYLDSEINGKKPKLDLINYLDAFNVSTIKGATYLKEKYNNASLFSFLDDTLDYDCEYEEECEGNDFLHPVKYHYHFILKGKGLKKTKLKFNLHTHCNYCNHAEGSVIDYLDYAYKAGYECIGMSDHGPLPDYFYHIDNEDKTMYLNGRMDFDKMVQSYIKDIDEGKKKYEGKMKVLSSIEIEYFEGREDYIRKCLDHLDYLVMGEHYNYANGEIVNTYGTCNYKNVIAYAKVIEKGLNTGMFKVIAHPDIYMLRYISENGIYREFDENAKTAARIIISAACKNNVYLELNCGGLSRGKVINKDGSIEYGYPRSEFWKIVREEYKDAKIVIGVDAHSPNALDGKHIDRTGELAREWGLDIINLK